MSITYDEIHDTFNALKKTIAYIEERWGDIELFLKGKSRFVFVGCGSSYSIAKSFAMLCNMGTGKPSAALAAGDIILHSERYNKAIDGAVVVFISRSGRTSELLMALDALESQGCDFEVASLVCADDTPLGARSGLVLSTPWAFDESVCQTRCVTNFYFTAAYVYAKIAGDQSLVGELQSLTQDGETYLTKAGALASDIALEPWTHVVVLADAELEGLAEEGSLVFKEVCQLPSNYHHLLDVRHGPMVLVGEKTLVIAVIDGSKKLETDLLMDLKNKAARIVAFCCGAEGLEVKAELDGIDGIEATDGLDGIQAIGYGRPLSHITSGIPLIILCQLTAYYKSKSTGADPDKPEGLDPWISL